LAGLIKSSFAGEDSKPDAFRTIEYQGIRDVIPNLYMMADLTEYSEIHPLGHWSAMGRNAEMYVHKFATVLNSERLGVLCNLPTREFHGYYVDRFVEFDAHDRLIGTRSAPIAIGEIKVAGTDALPADNGYAVEKNDLTRHALIVGITGGGKTNTSKSILSTLWAKEKVPFLVIESAKREYWELRNIKGFEDLTIFTLGDESTRTAVPYRINPFEANPGVSLQTHIDYLLAAFKAAFDLYPPAPYILEQAVYEVYADRGWDTVENTNRYGLTRYPTLSDLYDKIEVVVDRLGYHAEVKSNVKAALSARIYSLMIGGKGTMLDTATSVPIERLLSSPVVLELEDLGDDETKSFVIGVLLVQLYEHRKSQMTSGSKTLSHILLVEEAHRLLKNVPETGEGGNTRARAVEFFCNMLAEIRTYGQGIIIADQIPTKLAPDTIKNTNLKIVHRTVAQDDRETIGGAMNMSEAQIEYLSSLKRGYAAVYAEGDNRPKLVKMPLVEYWYANKRTEVVAESRGRAGSLLPAKQEIQRHHAACVYCEHNYDFYSRASPYIQNKVDCGKVLAKWNVSGYAPKAIQAFLNADLMRELGNLSLHQQLCVIGIVLEKNKALSVGKRKKVVADYLEYICQNKEDKSNGRFNSVL
jgi:DNA helicase HerA-like ATPase